MSETVRQFADLWVAINERPPDPNAASEKQMLRMTCLGIVFGLFLVFTICCLVLVMLAIERNTRLVAQKYADVINK